MSSPSTSSQQTLVSSAAALMGVLLIVASVGCSGGGPPLYPVSGRVQFPDGDPVRYATIEFIPSQPGPSPRGRIDREGRFTLSTYEAGDGAAAGEYRVVVVQALSPAAGAAFDKLGGEHASHAAATQVVSPKHASPQTTGLTRIVSKDASNEFVVEVEAL